MEAVITVDGNFAFTGSATVSYVGPGAVEFLTNTEPNTFNVKMTVPGIYYFTAEVPDEFGTVYTDTAAISVMDKTAIDTLLQAKWSGMKNALALQEIETGLGYFQDDSQEKYRNALNAIFDDLPQLFSNMQHIEMIYLKNNRSKYRINRLHDINGSSVTITYYIYFIKDINGLWKLEQF